MKEAMQRWNIWWEHPETLNNYTGIPRTTRTPLLNQLTLPHIKDIIGVRRCGKTTLLYQIITHLINNHIPPHHILYLNFDDPELSNLPETIKTSLHLHPHITHIFLDEIQNIPKWEQTLRVYYDQKKFTQIFVSGSSSSLITRDVGTTLTGRHLTSTLTPFSFNEYLQAQAITHPTDLSQRETIIHHLETYLHNGGFPETIKTDPLTSKTILVDLYNDILARDIVSRFNVDLSIVKQLGYYLMTNTSTQFSYNSIARTLNLHYDTVKKYIPYFEEVFLIYTIPYFSWKIKTTIKKDIKAYAIDTGLRNAVSFKFSQDLGKLAENLVLIELKRQGKNIYFWKGKNEVDFVIHDQNTLTALNVTYTDAISQREKKGLLEFKQHYSNAQLILLTKENEFTDDHNITALPLWKWLLNPL
ncbi:MAG: ATP-binding protein [Candidatus Thermoplasmatota archaeon]|nr:ATP-binding protein [Candidatus Thermoplasmatota archaeon]MBU1940323.1 ATP-binding protein [Candidatus Thermoplasmatota archaeon]